MRTFNYTATVIVEIEDEESMNIDLSLNRLQNGELDIGTVDNWVDRPVIFLSKKDGQES